MSGTTRRPQPAVARKTYGADGVTKTGQARWVDPPRQLCDELAAHLAAQDHEPEARVSTDERGGPLAHKWFYTHRFKPVEELSARGELPTIERPAGAGGDAGAFTLRFHALRHTCVALLIAKGAQQYEAWNTWATPTSRRRSTPTGTCSRTSASASAWPSKTPGTRVHRAAG